MLSFATITGMLCIPVLHGEVLGPYTPDQFTLHLWHLNESAVPVVDAATNGLDLTSLENGATLENESYLGTHGFGGALGTYTGNPNIQPGSAGQDAYLSAQPLQNGPGDNVTFEYSGPNDAFTYEAIVRIDFDPTLNLGADGWGAGKNPFMQIICADADEAANRLFQFRLVPIGCLNANTQPLLEFINLNKGTVQSLTASIPTDGAGGIRIGAWYHVAVTYNGQPDQDDNIRFYWTPLSRDRMEASLIGTGRMTSSLPKGCSPDFTIGQIGRQSPMTSVPNNNFVGLIDEVRISSVARASDEMLFGKRGAIVKHTGTPAATVAATEVKEVKPAKTEPAPVSNPAPAKAVQVPAKEESPSPAVAVVKPAARPKLPEGVIQSQGAVVRGPAQKRQVAIAFSCRESDESTPIILSALKSHHAKASFFLTGDFLDLPGNVTLTRGMVADGHFVGPQADTWSKMAAESHTAPTDYPDVAKHFKQLEGAGVKCDDVHFFLPTAEELNDTFAEHARGCGLTMVAGTPGTLSMSTTIAEHKKGFVSSQAVLNSIVSQDRRESSGLNGYILLFRLDSSPARKDKFAAYFGQLIDFLNSRGYELVRVDQLLKEDNQ